MYYPAWCKEHEYLDIDILLKDTFHNIQYVYCQFHQVMLTPDPPLRALHIILSRNTRGN